MTTSTGEGSEAAEAAQITAAAEQVRAELADQRDRWSKGFTRRRFLAGAGAVAAAALGSQLVTTRYSYAAPGTGSGATLVVVFLRGGFDGLATVVPGSDPDYAAARPAIGIPPTALLPLDRRFGLHPACAPLYEYWKGGQFAVVHAVGSHNDSRSHFAAQEVIERGVGSPSTRTGWLERALDAAGPGTTFRAISEGPVLPGSLAGSTAAVSLRGVESLLLRGGSKRVGMALRGLFTGIDHPAGDQVDLTLRTLDEAAAISDEGSSRGETSAYPAGEFGAALADVARLVRARVGLRVATIDVGGWDLHTDAGRVDSGDMTGHLTDLSAALAMFAADLGRRLEDVTLVTMSEFGRRVKQNGSGGTDHGHGGVMFLLGGPVAGGVVHGSWPGLAPDALMQGDLAGPNDYRDVLGEVVQRQLGIGSLASVFPDHEYAPLGLMRR